MLRGIFVAGVALLTSAGAASAATTYTFGFNGFCDGMTLTVTGGAVSGVSTGCDASNPDIGRVAKTLKGTTNILVVSSSNLAVETANPAAPETYVIDLVHEVWSNYRQLDATHEVKINSGTLTFGPADAFARKGASSSR